MKTSPNDASNNQVLAEISKLNGRFDTLEGKTDELGEAIQEFASQVDERFTLVEREQTRMRSLMVTKDYLDEKLADHHADIVSRMRKEDQKILVLAKGK